MKAFSKLSERFSKITEKSYIVILIVSIFFFELLLGLQGFDLCDEGWVLTGFQQIFNEPSSVEYQFLYYNSLIIGGVWEHILGNFGILSFRILSILIIVLSSIFVYKTLKPIINRWYILIGLFCVILNRDSGVIVFHHNYLTALLSCMAVYYLYKGLINSSLMDLFLSFFIIGVNVFTRLPNFTLFSLGILIFLNYYYYRNKQLLYRQLIIAVSGFIIGILLIVMLMATLNHFDIFKNSLVNIVSLGSAEDSSHNLLQMLKLYYQNYDFILQHLLLILFPFISILFIIKHIRKDTIRYICLICCLFMFISIYVYFSKTIYFTYAFISLILIVAFYKYRKEKKISLLCLISFIVVHFLPLGSDGGMGNMGNSSIWIALPLCIGLFVMLLNDYFYYLKKYYILTGIVLLLIFSFLLSN
jgi:hypothetical protein